MQGLVWTDEQKKKARPRIVAACKAAIAAAENLDFEQFWLLTGMLAGGMEKIGHSQYAAVLLRASEAEGLLNTAVSTIAACQAIVEMEIEENP